MAYTVAVIIRVGAVVILAVAIPFVWGRFAHPLAGLAVALGLAVTAALVLLLWHRAGTITRTSLLIDVPVGLAALFLNAWLTPDPVPGWSYFAYPHTIFVAITLGMVCRRATLALALGLIWAAGYSLATILFHHTAPLATLTTWPAYLGNALIGWATVLLQRRTTTSLEQARSQELAAAATLAAERVRLQQASALHDRVLQTLETLTAGNIVASEEHRARIRTHALWLRGFVRDGDPGSLAAELEAAAETARRAGLSVDVHDATPQHDAPALGDDQRNALVNATAHLLDALARHNTAAVVHVEPEPGRLLVTILGTAGGTALADHDLTVARALLSAAGGELLVEPLPYLELRVPSAQ
jgi:hypothetical protein